MSAGHDWPFDGYRASDVQVLAFSGSGAARVAVPVQVAVTDSSTPWAVHATEADSGPGKPLDIHVTRTGASVGFGIAMCAVLLFSVLPIRNLFPGSPPIGSWVDYTVVLWMVMGLAVSLALYVTAWWRQAP
ncbi:DUF4436 family protein [Mycobacterium yunnanensis]|uniref:DUF4436 family protein n=1 Tax=Mycobacterium yunnanensis TaxID=368477 RepID=A0A9X3C1R8_9MYCO|nr:DUF4436 domain-containing protein [Mycobacterium yunnanensis]MCV7419407.1 DUF4436 family protein [Mycobacterium yunnanensis]